MRRRVVFKTPSFLTTLSLWPFRHSIHSARFYEILAPKVTASQLVHNISPTICVFSRIVVFTVFLAAFRRNVPCCFSEIAAGSVFLYVLVAEQSIVSKNRHERALIVMHTAGRRLKFISDINLVPIYRRSLTRGRRLIALLHRLCLTVSIPDSK